MEEIFPGVQCRHAGFPAYTKRRNLAFNPIETKAMFRESKVGIMTTGLRAHYAFSSSTIIVATM